MDPNKSKPDATEQRAQSTARLANKKDEVPSLGEQAKEAVFDDDSMFNSADRQSAFLLDERTGGAAPQKTKNRKALKPAKRRKAA